MHARSLMLCIALALPFGASAADWTGSGELGLAVARGNSRSENLNAKLNFVNEDDQWKHKFDASALRAKGEVTDDFDGDGIDEERFEVNANRYELGASSAFKMNDRASWVGAARYENDDFSAYEHQETFSIGFGYELVDTEATELSTELGPGFRHAKLANDGTESDMIFRGVVDYSQKLTANTKLTNELLVESGDDNTFARNEFGVSVAMNASFALKAGVELRHNSEVQPGVEKTDTLTTVNLVYNLK